MKPVTFPTESIFFAIMSNMIVNSCLMVTEIKPVKFLDPLTSRECTFIVFAALSKEQLKLNTVVGSVNKHDCLTASGIIFIFPCVSVFQLHTYYCLTFVTVLLTIY